MKCIDLSYQHNLRDLGGLKTKDGRRIKYGRLFRSGALKRVSKEDIEMVDSLHLTDIVDFRGNDEFTGKGDYPFEGVAFHNFSAMDQDVNNRNLPEGIDTSSGDFNLMSYLSMPQFDGLEWMKRVYRDLAISDVGVNAYRNFFSVLLKDDTSNVLWHCSQGKDRAGIASYLLEIALGVSEEDAKEDYLLTQVAMEKKISELKGAALKYAKGESERAKALHDLRDVFSALPVYLEVARQTINETYGSAETFIVGTLGVDIERLRGIYLE